VPVSDQQEGLQAVLKLSWNSPSDEPNTNPFGPSLPAHPIRPEGPARADPEPASTGMSEWRRCRAACLNGETVETKRTPSRSD
jgi:hypothetical protein